MHQVKIEAVIKAESAIISIHKSILPFAEIIIVMDNNIHDPPFLSTLWNKFSTTSQKRLQIGSSYVLIVTYVRFFKRHGFNITFYCKVGIIEFVAMFFLLHTLFQGFFGYT